MSLELLLFDHMMQIPHSASFGIDATTIWNDLPADVSSAPSLMLFRSRVKAYLFGKAYPPYQSSYPSGSPWCRPCYVTDS